MLADAFDLMAGDLLNFLLSFLPLLVLPLFVIYGMKSMYALFVNIARDDPRPVKPSKPRPRALPPFEPAVKPAPVVLARPSRYDTGCPDPDCRYCHPSPRQAIMRAANLSPLVPPPLEMWRGWDQGVTRPGVKS